jgi:hypothetical protein
MAEKVNRNQVERTTSANTKPSGNSVPKVGIVRNHLDSTYMGNLQVELISDSSAGSSTNAPGQLITVKYLSPFAGITSYDGMNQNADYRNSQRSYGFWGVPPDIGAKVLVLFADSGQGYWIGCIPEESVNIMMPDPWVSTTYNDSDNTKKLPVVEYNKKVETGTARNATKFIKPANQDAIDILTEQGLIEDEIRGTTTSSARREVPSTVLGFSSPGPLDERPGAPRVNYGENFAQTPVAQNRLGGSSLVFDDGDATLLRKTPAGEGPAEYANAEAGETDGQPDLPHNELVRLRTRTGHQILLHNTEDLIYIANAKGTTWIELTSNGKIDIYAQDSISVHTENDLNFTADRDINFNAGRDIHMNAGTSIFQTAASNWEIKAGADGKITCGGSSNIKSAHHIEKAGKIDMNGPAAAEATDANVPTRVPQHEPWAGHENFNPTSHTPDKTDGSVEEAEEGTAPSTPDTFRQNTTRESGSTPATPTPEQQDTAEPTTATEPENGVINNTSTNTTGGIPAGVADSAQAVNSNMNSGTVSGFINSVADAASSITHGVGQAIVGTIDAIAGPNTLKNIANVGGEFISDITSAAKSLLGTRTSLAKGNTPPAVPPRRTTTSLGTPEDRKIIADVGAGLIPAGQTVTMSDGTSLTVVEDESGNRSLVSAG